MSTELETRPAAPLFTGDPGAVLVAARMIAEQLGAVIRDRHLAKRIGNRDYVLLEGWTLLGSMVGVFAEVEWTRPVLDAGGRQLGWEARAVARSVDGRAISAAEAMCARDEVTWRQRDEYALRSMAQTRAISKALRLPLGFIVELAGYNATPADEVPAPGFTSAPRAPSIGMRRQIDEAAKARGIGPEQLREIADEVGVRERASQTQLRQILTRVEAMPPLDTDLDDLPDVPDGTDAELGSDGDGYGS